MDANSFCWRLLGSSAATQRYNIRPCRIKSEEVIVSCGTNTLADFTQWQITPHCQADPKSVSCRLPGATPATRLYKVHPHAGNINKVTTVAEWHA